MASRLPAIVRASAMAFGTVLLAISVQGFAGAADGQLDGLVASLKGGDARARSEAARQLGRMGTKALDAVPALVGALGDDDGSVRVEVGLALAKIDTTQL